MTCVIAISVIFNSNIPGYSIHVKQVFVCSCLVSLVYLVSCVPNVSLLLKSEMDTESPYEVTVYLCVLCVLCGHGVCMSVCHVFA